MMIRPWWIGALAISLLAGCGSTPPAPEREVAAPTASGDSPVIGPRWQLILLGTDERWEGAEPAWFEAESGRGGWRLMGSDGCRRLEANLALDDGNRIVIEGLDSGPDCAGAPQAPRVAEMMQAAHRYLIDHDRLVFFGRDSRVLGGFRRR
ncbi:META domain-containing protein [Bisbaumannia pacifica]|uniref:META domain-containing protein n=1 Tax=Bisbaumannia pacifica TaxID=77098 RepID=A0ABD4KXX2_9GAMM|nr:META domain-containing protein [Halomonas pacifica]MBH8579163.1 META domain-containing protein [Halomonas pacifica]